MLVRVITPRGYDYVREELLRHFINQGYVLALAESIEETKERAQRKFKATMDKFFGRTTSTQNNRRLG